MGGHSTTADGGGFLDALLDDDHPRKRAAADWAAEALAEYGSGFDRGRWTAAAEFGIQGLTAPVELGGGGCSVVDSLLTFEGLGLGAIDNGAVFALSASRAASASAARAISAFSSANAAAVAA